jgi:hypothetical protein
MKKLVIALAAIVAATLFSGNAFAFSGNQARGVQAANAVVKVHYCHRCYRPRRYYRTCGCGYCGCYRPTYYYAYTGRGSCYGGWGWGGFPVFGWFF